MSKIDELIESKVDAEALVALRGKFEEEFGKTDGYDSEQLRWISAETGIALADLQIAGEADGLRFDLSIEDAMHQLDEQRGARYAEFNAQMADVDQFLVNQAGNE